MVREGTFLFLVKLIRNQIFTKQLILIYHIYNYKSQ